MLRIPQNLPLVSHTKDPLLVHPSKVMWIIYMYIPIRHIRNIRIRYSGTSIIRIVDHLN